MIPEVSRGKEEPMSRTTLIVVIIVLVILIGGYGFL